MPAPSLYNYTRRLCTNTRVCSQSFAQTHVSVRLLRRHQVLTDPGSLTKLEASHLISLFKDHVKSSPRDRPAAANEPRYRRGPIPYRGGSSGGYANKPASHR